MSNKKVNSLLEHKAMIEKSAKWCEAEITAVTAELEVLAKDKKAEDYENRKEVAENRLIYLINKIKFEGREAKRFEKMTEKGSVTTNLRAALRKKLK